MQWLAIEAVPPGYEANRAGEVRNARSRRIIKPAMNQTGNVYIGLMGARRQVKLSLPKLIADMFLPRPVGFFDVFNTPINLDGDKWNCSVGNLAWRPRWFAMEYTHQFVHPFPHPINRRMRPVGTDMVFDNSFEAATFYGLLERNLIEAIHQGRSVWPTNLIFEIVD